MPEQTVHVIVRLPVETHRDVKQAAESVRRSMHNWLVDVITLAADARKAALPQSPAPQPLTRENYKNDLPASMRKEHVIVTPKDPITGERRLDLQHCGNHTATDPRWTIQEERQVDEAQARREADPDYIAMMERHCARHPDTPAAVNWRKRHPASDEQEAADDLARILAKKMPPLGTTG